MQKNLTREILYDFQKMDCCESDWLSIFGGCYFQFAQKKTIVADYSFRDMISASNLRARSNRTFTLFKGSSSFSEISL